MRPDARVTELHVDDDRDLVERGLKREEIRVIHPGVDTIFFTPDPSVKREAVPTFLYLGRLKRYKGVELIVRALARLRAEGVDARVIVAGRGEHLDALKELTRRLGADDRVTFPGFVTEEEKRLLFRRSWANLFPSPKEGWGITNLEAAACGTPSIASDSPGLRESVRHGRTGLLVPHGDVAALAAAMRRLTDDPAEVDRLGQGALRFSARFTWDDAAIRTETHLREVVDAALRASGWHTTYLGAALPPVQLAQYLHDTGPDALARVKKMR